MKINAPNIPDSHVKFAEAVAIAARENGIQNFHMTYRPDFEGRLSLDEYISGDLQIFYNSTDGRGRPANQLSIRVNAVLEAPVSAIKNGS